MTKYRPLQKICASTKLLASIKIYASTKLLASTKYRRRQKLGVGRNVGADAGESPYCQAQQNPQLLTSLRLMVMLLSVHQVRHCLQLPRFHGRTVPAYCTGLPCWKCQKTWRRQNIAGCLKFTDFRQTIAVHISAHRRPIKKWWKHKIITITVQYQFLYSRPPNQRLS